MPNENLGSISKPKKKGLRTILAVLIGMAVGVSATILVPRLAGPYLPETFKRGNLNGRVLAKETETDWLLLKVSTEHGALLATFTQKVKEIDLLVENEDLVTLGVSRYQPFLENPDIEHVEKPKPSIQLEGVVLQPPSGKKQKEKADRGEP